MHCLACILDDLYEAVEELEQSDKKLDWSEQELVRQVKLIVEQYRRGD